MSFLRGFANRAQTPRRTTQPGADAIEANIKARGGIGRSTKPWKAGEVRSAGVLDVGLLSKAVHLSPTELNTQFNIERIYYRNSPRTTDYHGNAKANPSS